MIYDYIFLLLEGNSCVSSCTVVQGTVAQDTNLFNLRRVPPYLVRGGVHKLLSLMKMYTYITCQIP